MKRRGNPIFLVIGIIFSLMAVFVLIKMIRFTMFDPDSGSTMRVQLTDDISLVNSIPVVVDNQLVEEAPKQESEQWMTFSGMDLLDEKVGFTFSMRCPVDKKVDILPIEIIPGIREFSRMERLALGRSSRWHGSTWVTKVCGCHSGWDFWLGTLSRRQLSQILSVTE